MRCNLIAISLSLCLTALSGSSSSAGEPAFFEPATECAAADAMAYLYPELLSEKELEYYRSFACATLEHFLAGEPLFVGEADATQDDGTPAAGPLSSDAGGMPLDESQLNRQRDEPVATGEDLARSFGRDEFIWPEADRCDDPGIPPPGVLVVMDVPAADPDLLAMQKEYISLGCTEHPESEKCLDSRYAKRVKSELEQHHAW